MITIENLIVKTESWDDYQLSSVEFSWIDTIEEVNLDNIIEACEFELWEESEFISEYTII
jgi:hypothetical protein